MRELAARDRASDDEIYQASEREERKLSGDKLCGILSPRNATPLDAHAMSAPPPGNYFATAGMNSLRTPALKARSGIGHLALECLEEIVVRQRSVVWIQEHERCNTSTSIGIQEVVYEGVPLTPFAPFVLALTASALWPRARFWTRALRPRTPSRSLSRTGTVCSQEMHASVGGGQQHCLGLVDGYTPVTDWPYLSPAGPDTGMS